MHTKRSISQALYFILFDSICSFSVWPCRLDLILLALSFARYGSHDCATSLEFKERHAQLGKWTPPGRVAGTLRWGSQVTAAGDGDLTSLPHPFSWLLMLVGSKHIEKTGFRIPREHRRKVSRNLLLKMFVVAMRVASF